MCVGLFGDGRISCFLTKNDVNNQLSFVDSRLMFKEDNRV
ncbi:hypothetical protein T12_10431 [Trichinella patagoniensis]|uniref:Uncharacterized protein n=1 Tax=Trichinella patagoniensis TaxID=990121 RepID=A0A0V0YWM2_9BILA|nr:hypothetical protein T12_10431 [Trichinella patagoniensis]